MMIPRAAFAVVLVLNLLAAPLVAGAVMSVPSSAP
jgi:hypothetical protein